MVLFFTYDTAFALCWASASIVWPVVWWEVGAFRSKCVLIIVSFEVFCWVLSCSSGFPAVARAGSITSAITRVVDPISSSLV